MGGEDVGTFRPRAPVGAPRGRVRSLDEPSGASPHEIRPPGNRDDGRARRSTPAKKKLYIETVGCQMNVLDSELVVAKLRRRATS